MLTELKEAVLNYGELRDHYVKTYGLISSLRDKVKNKKYTMEEMVDILYVMRRCSQYLDDIRKEVDGVNKTIENVCCLLYVHTNANEPEKAGPIRGTMAMGSPRIRMQGAIPNKNKEPEKYKALLQYFGVSEDSIDKKLFYLHWPNLCEEISRLAAEGKPLPPGMDPSKLYPNYSISIRQNVEDMDVDSVLDELEENEEN